MVDRAKLLSKLAKLKALSECPTGNPNETAAAAERMTRLMLEAGIAQSEFDAPTASCSVTSHPCSDEWRFVLAGGLAQANGCECLHENSKVLLVGDADDIEAVRAMWVFAQVEIDKHAKTWVDGPRTFSVFSFEEMISEIRIPRGSRHAQVAQFCLGAATMVVERAIRERNRVLAEQVNSKALVWLDNKAARIDEFLESQGVKRIAVDNIAIEDERAFEDGIRAGNGIRVERERRMLE